MNQSVSNLKLAERGAIISILTYLFLSAAKLATGHLLHSSSGRSDDLYLPVGEPNESR